MEQQVGLVFVASAPGQEKDQGPSKFSSGSRSSKFFGVAEGTVGGAPAALGQEFPPVLEER